MLQGLKGSLYNLRKAEKVAQGGLQGGLKGCFEGRLQGKGEGCLIYIIFFLLHRLHGFRQVDRRICTCS